MAESGPHLAGLNAPMQSTDDDEPAAHDRLARAMRRRCRRHGWTASARVVAQHRAGYQLHDGADRCSSAQPAAAFSASARLDPAERPAVGDFVLVEPGSPPLIRDVLPRRSELAPRAPRANATSARSSRRTSTAVFVLIGLDGDFNPRAHRALPGADPGQRRAAGDRADQSATRPTMRHSTTRPQLRERLPAQLELHGINAKDSGERRSRCSRICSPAIRPCWSAPPAPASRR